MFEVAVCFVVVVDFDAASCCVVVVVFVEILLEMSVTNAESEEGDVPVVTVLEFLRSAIFYFFFFPSLRLQCKIQKVEMM